MRRTRALFPRIVCLRPRPCVCASAFVFIYYIYVSNFKSKHIALALISAFFCCHRCAFRVSTNLTVHCVHILYPIHFASFSPDAVLLFCINIYTRSAREKEREAHREPSHFAVCFSLLSFRAMGSRFACFSYACFFPVDSRQLHLTPPRTWSCVVPSQPIRWAHSRRYVPKREKPTENDRNGLWEACCMASVR